jgi:hypothetical protein
MQSCSVAEGVESVSEKLGMGKREENFETSKHLLSKRGVEEIKNGPDRMFLEWSGAFSSF